MQRSREELDRLKVELGSMRAQGWSIPRIADKLGMTRDQCSGLVNRLLRGYKSPSQYEAMKKRGEAPAEFVPPGSGPRPRPSHPVTIEALPIVKTDLSFEPPPGRVNIWNVRAGQCRWVDEEGYFCAETTGSSGKSYCPEHHARCFYKTERKAKPKCRSYQPRVLENFV